MPTGHPHRCAFALFMGMSHCDQLCIRPDPPAIRALDIGDALFTPCQKARPAMIVPENFSILLAAILHFYCKQPAGQCHTINCFPSLHSCTRQMLKAAPEASLVPLGQVFALLLMKPSWPCTGQAAMRSCEMCHIVSLLIDTLRLHWCCFFVFFFLLFSLGVSLC